MIPFLMLIVLELDYLILLWCSCGEDIESVEHVLLRFRENEKARTVMMDCILNILKSSRCKANHKINITKVCCWCITVKVTVSVEGKTHIAKKHCLSLLPALKNESNITSCSKLLSFHTTLVVFTFSDFTRSVYHGVYH